MASQQDMQALQSQVGDLRWRQYVADQRLCELDRKAASLDARDRQLAEVMMHMLFHDLKGTETITKPAKAEASKFSTCLTACATKLYPVIAQEQRFEEACKGISECGAFLDETDGRQQVLP